MSLEERVRRFHFRATVAFVILALGGIFGLYQERQDASSATHRAELVQRSEAHNICVAVNDVRAEAQAFVVKLAPDNPIPHDAGAPLRASINRANAYKRAVRGQARASFKIARCP